MKRKLEWKTVILIIMLCFSLLAGILIHKAIKLGEIDYKLGKLERRQELLLSERPVKELVKGLMR